MKATLYFDGACMPNPGVMGIGAVIDGPDGQLAEICEKLDGVGTNNVAEYTAVIRGMKKALELGIEDLTIRGDSGLVIHQLSGKFRVREPRLRPFLEEAAKLAAEFHAVAIQWIPREQNKRADALSYKALGPPPSAPGAPAAGTLGSKPSAREHSILCPKCSKPCTLTIQQFKDGSEHVRQECLEHGFIGYAPNVEPFLSLARKSTS